MARILWFALGAAAGMAYASRIIDKERLDLPPGLEEQQRQVTEIKVEEKKPSFKEKLADRIDEQADKLANLIDARVIALTDMLHTRGHELASKLRGEQAKQPGSVTLYGEPFMVMTETDVITSQADTGLEANRRPGEETL